MRIRSPISRFHARSYCSYQYHFYAVRGKRHPIVPTLSPAKRVHPTLRSRCAHEENPETIYVLTHANVSFKSVFPLSREKYHTAQDPTTAAPYTTADSVVDDRPHLILTTGRPNLVVGRIGRLGRWQSPSLNNNDEETIVVTCNQVVGESASQLGTEKSSLADKYTRQAPLTSLPEHGSADIWHHQLHLHDIRHRHLHLRVLLRQPQLHRVLQHNLQLPHHRVLLLSMTTGA